MSTTMITQLTGDGTIDAQDERFLIITVRENDAEGGLRNAIMRVSQSSLFDEDGDLDEIEMRASISSELKQEELQLSGLQVTQFAWMKE